MEQFIDFSKVTGCIVNIKSANNEAAGRGHRYNFVKRNPAKEKSFVPGLDEKIQMIGVIAPTRSSFDNRHKNYIRIALAQIRSQVYGPWHYNCTSLAIDSFACVKIVVG